jgi:YebC/PmpR family DNA-binding regulatory protein
MAGHSKWKNIQHRKGAQDARRGKIFTKLAKEIAVAARLGGEDPVGNARLRLAVGKARLHSMPKENIERAIKKGVGGGEGADYSEKTYEGYGPAGVAVMVECLTENVNRTVSEVRHAFARSGGNLGAEGSVSWMFKKKGILIYERAKVRDFGKLFEVASEAGAAEINDEGEVVEVIAEPSDFAILKQAMDGLELEPFVAEIQLVPDNTLSLDDDRAQSLTKLIELLEDHDDVQNVYHNADLA